MIDGIYVLFLPLMYLADSFKAPKMPVCGYHGYVVAKIIIIESNYTHI